MNIAELNHGEVSLGFQSTPYIPDLEKIIQNLGNANKDQERES